jgi:histidine triad (HIT) family protein
MEDCIFCKVITKEVPGHFVYEDDSVVAFLDIFGSTEGHTMVVPRKHGYSIFDYSEEELGEVMGVVKKVAKKIKKVYNSDAITIGINHEEKKGVPHLHVHLIPRFESDGGAVVQSLTKREIKRPMEEIAKELHDA